MADRALIHRSGDAEDRSADMKARAREPSDQKVPWNENTSCDFTPMVSRLLPNSRINGILGGYCTVSDSAFAGTQARSPFLSSNLNTKPPAISLQENHQRTAEKSYSLTILTSNLFGGSLVEPSVLPGVGNRVGSSASNTL